MRKVRYLVVKGKVSGEEGEVSGEGGEASGKQGEVSGGGRRGIW